MLRRSSLALLLLSVALCLAGCRGQAAFQRPLFTGAPCRCAGGLPVYPCPCGPPGGFARNPGSPWLEREMVVVPPKQGAAANFVRLEVPAGFDDERLVPVPDDRFSEPADEDSLEPWPHRLHVPAAGGRP